MEAEPGDVAPGRSPLFARASKLAHTDLHFAGPYDDARVDVLMRLLNLRRGARVLDLGSGKAEMLIRIVERFEVDGVAVDLHLDEAREEAGSRLGSRSIDWHEIDAKDFQAPPGSFDLVMCVGSSHALGGLQPALAAMARFTKPGGRAILGEGFWAEPPSQAALEALGADPEDLEDFDSIMALAEQHGFRPSYVAVSDQGEWDRYERAWCRGIEFFCAQHPDDPEAPALLDLARDHREGYETGYRGVLGFVTCLFELPAA